MQDVEVILGRSIAILVCVMSPLISAALGQQNNIPIVPKPAKVVVLDGICEINAATSIACTSQDEEMAWSANYLSARLRTVTGLPVPVLRSQGKKYSIVLSIDSAKAGLKKEGYELTVLPTQIAIIGYDEAGVFYGIQTLLQLLPPEVESNHAVGGISWSVPCVKILDSPRFPWRGMHLDVGRHFFPVSFVKKYLDLMSMYKFNVFHWHLTEDQGWRIEIKKYPRLTEVGAWRKETMGDGVPYGGFYTRDDIREVISYAKDRHIEIVPEIEMPGHAMAALAAYPQFSCRKVPLEVATTWGIHKDVFCAGNDSTFIFLDNILSEIFDLFPGKYIHIGGDECPKDRWKECPLCQARIKKEGLKNEEELQSYFIKRIEQYVNSRGKSVIGWDEILEGGLAPNATVMSWRGTQGGIDAAQSGHDVVMTPTSNCYFDYAQALTGEVDSTRAFLPIDSVYDYEPVAPMMTAEEARHVLGSQGNVWTEWMDDSKRVEYMVLPRMCALSEVVWSPKELRNYDDFQKRLGSQYERFDCAGVDYRVPTPFTLGGPVTSFSDTTISFDGMPPLAKAFFTTDGSEPTSEAQLYTVPVVLKTSALLKAKLYLPGGRGSNTVWIDFSRLDPSVNGLFFVCRHPGPDSSSNQSHWVHSRSGVAWTVALPPNVSIQVPFSVRFSGFLSVENEGLYTFYLRADSGSKVTLNDGTVIGDSSPLLQGWREGKVLLQKGKHSITILDLVLNNRYGIALEYEGPGIQRRPIPSRLLTTK